MKCVKISMWYRNISLFLCIGSFDSSYSMIVNVMLLMLCPGKLKWNLHIFVYNLCYHNLVDIIDVVSFFIKFSKSRFCAQCLFILRGTKECRKGQHWLGLQKLLTCCFKPIKGLCTGIGPKGRLEAWSNVEIYHKCCP